MGIFNRVPKWDKILPVYGVIVLILYIWTLLWFFWKVPSWMYFLTFSEISVSLAYSLAVNLLESLAVLVFLITLCLILPQKWFYDAFIPQAVGLILPGLGFMMYLAMQFQTKEDYPSLLLRLSPLVALGIAVFSFLISRVAFLRKVIELFADRATIFAYITIPASLISVGVIVIRLVVYGVLHTHPN